MSGRHFGVVGLGVMGRNLALNIERNGFSVAGFDLETEKREDADKAWSGKQMTTVASLAELVQSLEPPRRVLMMVPAGKAVDTVIENILPLLEDGDILIDGGNSFFGDTERRAKALAGQGVHFFGMGVSGGEEGALHGPSIMPGGNEDAYKRVEPILTSIAAKTADGPCCTWLGPRGAGHYVKMVHNGIEYGIMQLICEAYDLMKSVLRLTAGELHNVFNEWNRGELNSFLMEITSTIFTVDDEISGKPLVDVILDKAGQKGTGKWTSQNAFDLGVSIPTINAAVEARILSAYHSERQKASEILKIDAAPFKGDKQAFINTLHDALSLAIISSYAQGFALMHEASKDYGYNLNFVEIARIWKGGCIIRAKLLDKIMAAFSENMKLANLLISPEIAKSVSHYLPKLRETVSAAAVHGVPVLALSASLGYVEGYHHAWLPANLLQAQRDLFGAHTYRRLDKPETESFHTVWPETGEDK